MTFEILELPLLFSCQILASEVILDILRLGTMHAPRGPDLPSFTVYLHTDMHSAHQHNYKLH